MEGLSAEAVSVITYLSPGFLAAWIFHSLTAHPKATPFERVIQAVIFTLFVQVGLAATHSALLAFGRVFSVGSWNETISLFWGGILGSFMGVGFAVANNKDWPYSLLRKLRWTSHTSSPTEWFSAFHYDDRWIVLHLTGDRRLYGWPAEWPDHPDDGHFIITEPAWLTSENEFIQGDQAHQMLISSNDVEMVEFLKHREELQANE